jgi:hypothetical protein
MKGVKQFYYSIMFDEMIAYVTSKGHLIEPVVHHNTVQYYRIRDTHLGINDDFVAVHCATGGKRIASHRRVFIHADYNPDTYTYTYNETDLRLYRHLYRRYSVKRP